jgi:hypothetical protein
MKNSLVLLTVLLALIGFAGMMRVKTDVQTLTRVRQQLADQRLELKEHKRVLEAEYALLASPGRLKALALRDGYIPADPLLVEPMLLAPLVSATMAHRALENGISQIVSDSVMPVAQVASPT